MSLIRTDMTITPSFSRAGKTASAFSGGAAALHQLKANMKVDEQRKAAEAAKRGSPGPGGGNNKKGSSPSKHAAGGGNARWLEDGGREYQMSSSPRAMASWRLETADNSDDVLQLPKTIDWDLLDDVAEADMADNKGGGGILRGLVQAHNEKEAEVVPRKVVPSSAFMAVGRDLDFVDKRGNPEVGRYDPKWEITRRRGKEPLIVDRSLIKNDYIEDARPALYPEDPMKPQARSPDFNKCPARDDAFGGRMLAKVSPAEQKAMFSTKSKTVDLNETVYDTEVYWTKVVRKIQPVYKFSEVPRDANALDNKDAYIPRMYPAVQGHIDWLKKSPVMRTVATMPSPVMMSKMNARRPIIDVKDDTRIDYRQSPLIAKQARRTEHPRSASALEFSRQINRGQTSAAVRERQKKEGGGNTESLSPSDAAIRINTSHVVPFSKLLPKPPSDTMSVLGRDAPDVWYDKEASLKKTQDKRPSAPDFSKFAAGTLEPPPKVSAFLSYPNVMNIKPRERGFNMAKSSGHQPLVKVPEWVVTQELAAAETLERTKRDKSTRPSSVTGLVLDSGKAWNNDPIKGLHIATPDLGAGGKSRPSPAHKFLDKTYDLGASLKAVQARTPTVRIAGGSGAGSGLNSEEQRMTRQRLEEEIKGILQTKPSHYH